MNKYLEETNCWDCQHGEHINGKCQKHNKTPYHSETTPRTILEGTFQLDKEGIEKEFTWSTRQETLEEVEKRIANTKEEHYKELDRQMDSEPLYCDICQKQIGYIYANDLNGSKFYCSDCINQ